MPVTIVWFRRDLRLADNPALAAAADAGHSVVPVYLTEWEQGSRWAPGAAARWWLRESLLRLAADLERAGAPLRILSGDPVTVLTGLAATLGAGDVVWNALYDPWALELDARLAGALARGGVESRAYPAYLLFEPEGHLSRAGKQFVQFGAYWRSCLALPEPRKPVAAPAHLTAAPVEAKSQADSKPDLSSTWAPKTGESARAWQPGEEGAWERLRRFLNEALEDYPTARDYPGIEGVSRLSPHLHFGEISPHQVWHAIKDRAYPGEMGRRAASSAKPGSVPGGQGQLQEGADAFLRQLGWREFGHYLLYHFPHIATEPFRKEFSRFPWVDDQEGLVAWREGLTGFPLVDAGMRQLRAEGWMHNRVRMVVASFLTKDLLLPWQDGAAWFWEHLVDADLANNTLGWQWTAGSGPDAAPYFRVYNPALQARRFDPEHTYIDRWLGEAGSAAVPILDHAMARQQALEAFREMRSV